MSDPTPSVSNFIFIFQTLTPKQQSKHERKNISLVFLEKNLHQPNLAVFVLIFDVFGWHQCYKPGFLGYDPTDFEARPEKKIVLNISQKSIV